MLVKERREGCRVIIVALVQRVGQKPLTGALLLRAARHLVMIMTTGAKSRRGIRGRLRGSRAGGMLLTTTLLVDKVKEDVTKIHGPLLESIADIVTVVVDAGGCGRLRCSRYQRGGGIG